MPVSRKPTYGAAANMVRLAHMLSSSGRSLSVGEILEELEVSERTLRRYKSALDRCLLSDAGEPLLRAERRDGGEYWRLADGGTVTSTHYHLLSIYMGSILMSFLEGTVIRDGLIDVFEFLRERIPSKHRKLLRNHHRKFFYSAFGRKEYGEHDEHIDVLVRALLNQHPVEMVYDSARGRGEHRIHPYTLLMHRESLYLLAFSHSHGEIRMFRVENIRESKLTGGERFDYPGDYDPAALFAKSFGIFIAPEREREIGVTVEFGEADYDYVANRRWNPSQRVGKVVDGRFRMTAVVSDLHEIGHWVLGFGCRARVVEPPELREFVRDQARRILEDGFTSNAKLP